MRIFLLDPGYFNLGGHHVEWDVSIAKELVKRGHEVHLFCHKNTSAEAERAFEKYGSVNPVFDFNPYTRPQNGANEISLYIDVAMVTEHTLRQLPPADLWLWPTLFAPHLLASAIACPLNPVSGLIHQEPGFISPNGEAWWQYAFMKANRAGLNLHIDVTTPELQQLYSRLEPTRPIKCAPIPYDGLLASAPKKEMRRIGIFGHQREPKGTHLFSCIINKLLEDDYEVVVQDSSGGMEISNAPNLTVMGYIENFSAEISKCDLMLLPYRPDFYRYMLSGIAVDALSSGVPIVVPAGTALERLVNETGAGKVFSEYACESIINAIGLAKRDFSSIAQAAYTSSQEWPSKHGVANFVSSVLADIV